MLDLYFVLTDPIAEDEDIKPIVYSEIIKSIKGLKSTFPSFVIGQRSTIGAKEDEIVDSQGYSTVASAKDFFEVLEYLFEHTFKNQSPVIFFKTFGNKMNTITRCDDFKGILNRIGSTFTSDGFPYIIIDICVSASLGDNTVTLALPIFLKS